MMASSHGSRSSTPGTDAMARSPFPADADGGAQQKELRRGPWTVEEDLALVNYITDHGVGRWNTLAPAAGLKRTGKSCRLRWLNYLRPDVKRGNFTADEQMLILELHSRYGNRWSKIAQHLPGRTDNEIKNYWRTRVQKHAKQLNCDANSKRFKEAMRYLWMPHLVDAGDGRLLHAAEHQQAAANAGRDQDGYYYHTAAAAGEDVVCAAALSGMGGVTSSSSDSFATTTTSDSYDAFFPNKWDPAFFMRAGEMLATGGDCWAQEMLTSWPAAEQKAAAHIVAGGQFDDGELSGWVQSFSEGIITTAENSLWTLEDIWKTQ